MTDLPAAQPAAQPPAQQPAPPSPPPTATSELAVPESMLEPAQALAAATGSGIANAANAAATVNVQQTVIVNQRSSGPGFFTRAVWFLLIGWWLTGIAIGFAWLCSLTILLLPVAYVIVNKIPVILTLRPRSVATDVRVHADGTVLITTGGAAQPAFWKRALWFVIVGWWACLLAMLVAYALSLTIIGLPAGLLIFNRIPAVMTLQRN